MASQLSTIHRAEIPRRRINPQLLQQHFDTLAETPEAVVKSELILYQTEDNRTRIEVRLENETVWLTQAQILQATHFKKAELAKAEG